MAKFAPIMGGVLKMKLKEQQADAFMRLVVSIKQGDATACHDILSKSTQATADFARGRPRAGRPRTAY